MDKPRYIHFRYPSFDGLHPTGGVTVAYQLNEPIQGGPFITFAYSLCNIKDHYNKKLGRTIATGRLRTERTRHTFYPQSDEWFAEFEQMLFHAFESDVVPTYRLRHDRQQELAQLEQGLAA